GGELLFEPKVSPVDGDPDRSERNNRANAGVFKVEFQPKAAGDYRLKVVYEDSPDNMYLHKFTVRDSNPETDNVKPDVEVLWELASPAKKVLERIKTDAETSAKLRSILKRPEGLTAKDGEKKPEPGAERATDDTSM